MAKPLSITSSTLKATIYLLLMAVTLKSCADSARILNEDDPPITAAPPQPSNLATTPVSNVAPLPNPPIIAAPPQPSNLVTTSVSNVAPLPNPPIIAAPPQPSNLVTTPVSNAAPLPTSSSSQPSGGVATTAISEQVYQHQPLSFFMHDILGRSTPSGRVVTGIAANLVINGQLTFSKPNGGVFPINGGVPLLNINNGIINNNNAPFLAGLGGTTSSNTIIQNNGNNNIVNGGNTLPFVTAGQLPTGSILQNLMFGTITVIDDELTEGHEHGSSVLGKAQGFYLASSLDGSSQTMAVTTLIHSHDHDHDHDHEDDSLSFFGVHRTASPESQIAIIGGTGKYENAKGSATVKTLHPADQHTTDGVETLLEFSVYLTY